MLRKHLLLQLFMQSLVIKFLIASGEQQQTNGRAGNPSAEYADYYSNHISSKQFKIPTLESLFQIVSYKDKANTSSPCVHLGKKRQTECHKVVTFDRAGYEKSLQDTRRLILNRLNLEREPEVRISKNKMSFIDQLESKLVNEQGNAKIQQQKSRLDMKTPETNKILNSMHEASLVDRSCLSDRTASLCINFEIPARIFFGSTALSTTLKPLKVKKIQSVLLWVYIKTDEVSGGVAAVAAPSEENTYDLRIENLQSSSSLAYKNLIDGWNTIDVKSLIDLKSIAVDPSGKFNVTLALKCMNAKCSIGRTDTDPVATKEDSMYEATTPRAGLGDNGDIIDELVASISSSNNDDGESSYNILVSNSAGKKPLLSINIFENDDLVDPIASANGGGKAKNRGKRRTHSHNKEQGKTSGGLLANNYKVTGIDKENYTPKLCYNNYPDSNRECCLITYFVNFNSLKWSSWILSPSGFVANYCSGKCNEAKSECFNLV
jgi:hypothetical protein